ncbi:MAG: DNA alkylation response protein [Gammaproteobacteria bacterium]|nr:DNA alkylation response protein [Gammaproteobacteria bacterium]
MPRSHEVVNQPPPLVDYNVYRRDSALREWVAQGDAAWAEDDLAEYGALAGSEEVIRLGFEANEFRPVFESHDPQGRRVNRVRYHPAYHRLMAMAVERGIHSLPWTENRPGAHVVRGAMEYLQHQVESGHGCPTTMTFASVPTLRVQPDIAGAWEPGVTARVYDPRDVPMADKDGLTLGMAMTEKQGGSDVRANSTAAEPVGNGGPGEEYRVTGHKFFVSAPMSDGFVILAQTPTGLSCFLLPRWRADGTRNAFELQRLKNKMGNVSNASAEMELFDASAWLIGEPGRGVANIIRMVALTRFDCMVGSAGLMRQAAVQALHHCRHRSAFGRLLVEQPVMQGVLLDLVVESEAALALTMRAARALDADEQAAVRILTPIGKYWICKRTPTVAAEAMECIGGSGFMEDRVLARLYREAPVNAIWEGSGNVQCLDVLRAFAREPGTVETVLAELRAGASLDAGLERELQAIEPVLTKPDRGIEAAARGWVERLAIALQASTLLRFANPLTAEAFCRLRLPGPHRSLLPGGGGCDPRFAPLLERAF